MLTGRVLFGGDTPDEVLTKHLIDGPDFNTDWPPADAPIGLTEVLQCGLARNQEERYATAKALAEALNELTTTTKRETVPAIESTASVTPLTKNRTAAQTQWGVILGIVGVMGVVLVIALLASLNVFAPTLIATTTPGPTVTLEPTITPMRVSSTPTPAPTLGVGSKQVSDKDGPGRRDWRGARGRAVLRPPVLHRLQRRPGRGG